MGFGGGGEFGDGVGDDGGDFGIGEWGGKVGGEDSGLGFFLGGEIGALALFEAFDGVLAFFQFLTDDGERGGLVEDEVNSALFDGEIFEGTFEHADDAEAFGIAGFHGIF